MMDLDSMDKDGLPKIAPCSRIQEPYIYPGAHSGVAWTGSIPETPCPDDVVPSTYYADKADQGKLRYSLIEPTFLKYLAKVMTMGAEKYSANSWQGVEDPEGRYKDALLRHLYAQDIIDEESGLPHLAHAAANIMFLLWFQDQDKTNGEV